MAATEGTSVGFVTLVVFSLVSHLAELTLSALLAFTLSYDVTQRDVFFPLTSGLLILPLVLLQLASAVSLLRRRGDRMTSWEAGVMAALHVLQLGFVWRHLALLKGNDRNSNNSSSSLGIAISSNSSNNYVNRLAAGRGRGKARDLTDLLTLRLIFTFAGGFPLMIVELYLTVKGSWQTVPWPWALYGALATSVLSSVWALSSYQRRAASHVRHFRQGCPACQDGSSGSISTSTSASSSTGSVGNAEGAQLMSWPGSLFRIVWRGGELVSRVISLTLFACLYGPWVLLVLALHWLVMLLSLSLPQTLARGPRPPARQASATLSSLPSSSSSCTFRRAACCLLTSYAFVFAYVNTSRRRRRRAAVWYTLYYVIMFLENGTLSIVWLTKSPAEGFTDKYLLVFISTLAYLAAMVCLCVYYKYFHLHASSHTASCQHHLRGRDDDNKSSGMPVNGCCAGDLNSCRSGISSACGTNHLDQPHHSGLDPCPNGLHGPDSATRWLSQHHSTVSAGQCCKREASLLGSLSDLASLTTAGSLCGVGRAPRRTPKMGLGGSASTSLDSVVGVGLLRRGADGLLPRSCCGCCCCCSVDQGPGEADATSVVSCQTSRSAPSCPHPHHHQNPHPQPLLQTHQHSTHLYHHHHHLQHSLRNGGPSSSSNNNNTSRRCPHQKSCCRADLTDTTSVLTLTSGASHNNLGYEGSDEMHSNSIPAWLPRGESFIAKHLLSSAASQGGHGPKGEPQEKHLENYRQILRQEANRWAGETSAQRDNPAPASHNAESAASWEVATKQPQQQQPRHAHHHHQQQRQQQRQRQNVLAGEEEEEDDQEKDSDAGQCCRCDKLSPGDAEVSSIFKTAHPRTRSERCRLHGKPESSTPASSGIDGCDGDDDDDYDSGGCGGNDDGGGDVGNRAGIPTNESDAIQKRKGRERRNRASQGQSQDMHHHQIHHQPQPPQPKQHKSRRSKRQRQQPAPSDEPDEESVVPASCTYVSENAPEADPQTDELPSRHQVGGSIGNLPPVYGSARHGQRHAHHRTKRRTGASGDPENSRTHIPVQSDAKASSKSTLEKFNVYNEQRANAREPELRDDSEATPTSTRIAGGMGIHRNDGRDDHATTHRTGRRSEKRRYEELARSSARRSVSGDRPSDCWRTSPAERQTAADSGALERTAVADIRASQVEHMPSKLQVKAIAARSDEGDGPSSAARATSSRCSSPDPVYENVSIRPLPSVHVNLLLTPAANQNAGGELVLKSEAKDEFSIKIHETSSDKDTKSKLYADEEILAASELCSEKLRICDYYPLKSEDRVRNIRERQDYQPSRSTDKALTSAHPRYSSTSGRRTDSWYMCSESEDSALPPETFSSSVDDGVSDVGSDISFEFVI